MEAFRLFTNEIRLLSRSFLARTIVVVIAGLGALGINAVRYSNQLVLHGMNQSSATTAPGSANYAALGGAALFAMLTLLTLSRDQRTHSRNLLEACREYREVVWARIGALLAWACFTAIVAALAGTASHYALCEAAYEPRLYLFCYATVSLPAMVFSILICSGLYLATESLDVSFLTFGMLLLLGVTASDYRLLWVQGSAAAFSDFGGIEPVARYVTYNRLLWSALALAIMLTGQLLLRRRGCGVLGSVGWNIRNWTIPALWGVLVTLSVLIYRGEPYLFPNATSPNAQLPISTAVRLEAVESRLTLLTQNQSLSTEAHYTFEKEPATTNIAFVTNAGLDIESLEINGKPGSWETVPGTDRICLTLPAGPRAEVAFRYAGTIKLPSPGAFSGYICPESVYLLEACHWLFRPLTQSSGQIRVSGSVVAPRELTVVTPGQVEGIDDNGPTREWKYRAKTKSLSLGVFAADYVIERMSVGELEVEFYFSRRHAEAIRRVEFDRYAREILTHYQKSLGPYAFREWPIKVVEASLYKPGGHSSLNVVTLAEYLLNRTPPTNPSQDARFLVHDVKLLAHELAHQWWSTSVEIPDDGAWTSEGLTEYTAYRYYADNYHENISSILVRSWQSAVEANRDSYYARHPEVLRNMRSKFAQQIAGAARKVDVYDAMPLKLLKAEEHLGREAFSARLSTIYKNHSGGVLSLDDFLTEIGVTQEVLTLD